MMQKEKKRVPELRFAGFEGEWEKKKYKNIYSFITTNSYSISQLNYEDGKVKNIHYGDIHTKFSTLFDLSKELVPFINSDIDISRYKDENYCKEGDLVIADASEDYADIGKTIEIVNLNEENVLAGLHTFLARPKDNRMAIGFSGYMLQCWSVRKQVMTIAQGTKVRGIASGRLGNIFLTIPEKEEQQKIATFLTSIDTRIQQLEKKKTLLEQYKKGVMQKIFSQEIRFRDQDGKEFGEWQRRRLGEVFKSISTRPYQIKSKDFNPSGKYRIVDQGKDLIAGYSDSVDNVFNDLPIVVFGDHTTIIKFIEFDFIVGADGTKLLKNKRNDNLKYLFYNLSYNNVPQEGYKRHYSMLSEVSLQIPCLAEQTKIAHFLSALDRKIAVTNEQVEETKKWKKGLLQRMFV